MNREDVIQAIKTFVARTILITTVIFIVGTSLYVIFADPELRTSIFKMAGIMTALFAIKWSIDNWSPDV